MILTTCAACAAPLAHDAPRCVRCKTRYCDSTCQHDHWRRGHKQICKKIHRGGNAEQYNADKKYKEAVAVAVEACADDTKGQKCYICLEAVHLHTGEGLVRGCACGDRDGVKSPELGVAHVSCLARQAMILVAEVEEDNLGDGAYRERWTRWHKCSLCEQEYHGPVCCAMGWACWKTYADQSNESNCHRVVNAMTILGLGLASVGDYQAALRVHEAQLTMGQSEDSELAFKHNIARCHLNTGRLEEAARLFRLIYRRRKDLDGIHHTGTLVAATQLAFTLIKLERFAEVKALTLPIIQKHPRDTSLRIAYSRALYQNEAASHDDVDQAGAILCDMLRRKPQVPSLREVLGPSHPLVLEILSDLERVSMILEDRPRAT